MDVFVARQAIFDRELSVYGYELLSRSCQASTSAAGKDVMASLQVITNSYLSIGAEQVLAGKRAFVNFPREMLADERALVLPPQSTIIEILENVTPEPEVVAACRCLRDKGYALALDDYAHDNGWSGFLDLISIIKVDFRASSRAEQASLVRDYSPRGIRMIAEKVETQREFREARALGFDYFQGYFFARPVVLSRHEIPVYKVNHLKILREMQRPELNYRAIEALIRQEVSLATKLLRYVNSALFGWTQPVQSIIHALTAMGEAEIRVWVSLAALPSLTVDKPDELMRTALVRARFCEVLAPHVELGHRRPDLFLMGLFSLLDAMLDRPLNETLAELRLSGEIARVLLGKATAGDRFAGVYTLIREYETGQWDALAETAGRMGIAADIIPELYLDAVAWAEQILQY